MLRRALTDLVLVGPAALALVLFIFLPVAVVIVLSFTDYQFGARSLDWVGPGNYAELFASRLGRNALLNTLVYRTLERPVLAADRHHGPGPGHAAARYPVFPRSGKRR